MARVRVRGNVITVTGRDADKVIQELLMTPPIDFEKCQKEADEMVFPEYSEKGYARLRELGKLSPSQNTRQPHSEKEETNMCTFIDEIKIEGKTEVISSLMQNGFSEDEAMELAGLTAEEKQKCRELLSEMTINIT